MRDAPYTGTAPSTPVGAVLSVLGMGGVVLGILVWQEGGESVGALIAVGLVAMGGLDLLAQEAQARGQGRRCWTPICSGLQHYRLGVSQQLLQQIALGGLMIALPIYLQLVLEYNALEAGLSIAPLSLSMFAVAARWPAQARQPAPEPRSSGSASGSWRSGSWSCCRSCRGPTRGGGWSSRC